MQELTLAVVGIDFPNADGSNRRSAAMKDVVAIFQGIDGGSAFIRVRFGGDAPTLPPPPDKAAPARPPRLPRRTEPFDPHAFYPDEDGPEFGA